MKPLAHARIAAHRYGGSWSDWLPYHDFFDASKAAFASVQHRFFLHSDYGSALFCRLYGPEITVADASISTAAIANDHMEEDLGSTVPLTGWLATISKSIARGRAPKTLRSWKSDPTAGAAERYGGTPMDYVPLVSFFDEPRAHFGADDARADLVLHNAFGVFLAERLLGPAIVTDGRICATRSVAEDLVTARFGYIPSPSNIVGPIAIAEWMRGSRVPSALVERHRRVIDDTDRDTPSSAF